MSEQLTWEVVIRELYRVRGKGAGWPPRDEVVAHMEAIRDGLEGRSRADGSYSAARQAKCIHCDPSFKPTGPDDWCYCICHNTGEF